MAIIVSEEDWDMDGQADGVEPLERPEVARWLGGEWRFAPDVLAELGEVLVDLTRYEDAIAVYERFLRRYPGHEAEADVRSGLATARARCRVGAAPGFTCGVGAPP
jgi:hypothetical protein